MKKTYESVIIELSLLDNADVLTSSVESNEDVVSDIFG